MLHFGFFCRFILSDFVPRFKRTAPLVDNALWASFGLGNEVVYKDVGKLIDSICDAVSAPITDD